ncbi:MAG: hypothetical protein JO165_08720 [Candidatus Eremiobacteraeota bacterium]|nr:hypothetical protein [Candidatus Eremiobacteraeota bacterium]
MYTDPQDRYRKRLASGFAGSLIFHALLALLLFTLSSSSSEQASENVNGGEIVSVTTRAPVVPTKPVHPTQAKPVPVVAVPRKSRPRPVVQPHPRVLHELSKQAPTAPPNPTPQPQRTPVPQSQPTEAPIQATAAPIMPQPTSVPTLAPVSVAVKAPPTQSPPKPVPTISPTTVPKPVATAAPTAAPTFAPVIAEMTPQPVFTPGIPTQHINVPRPTPGVPSPGPTNAPHPAATSAGTAPSPGPKSTAAPGPRGTAAPQHIAPPRPVAAPPTPKPEPTSKPRPAKPTKEPPDINARLRSLIPSGPVGAPSQKTYGGEMQKLAHNLEPTPPPEVLAQTKFTSEHRPGTQRWKLWPLGSAPEESYVKFYVTDVRETAGVKTCRGWVVRYPIVPGGNNYAQPNSKWIIERDVTFICPKDLVPYTPPSPTPQP